MVVEAAETAFAEVAVDMELEVAAVVLVGKPTSDGAENSLGRPFLELPVV